MSPIPSAAEAYYRQLPRLVQLQPRLRRLAETVGRVDDLSLFQWAQLLAMILEFKPDLVLELGRGWGNSTCVFTEAAYQLGQTLPCRVVSLCLADTWRKQTLPKVRAIMPPEWFRPLTASETDICAFDFGPVLAPAQRVAVFWDAHGFKVAAAVLSRVLPAVAPKPHLVLMHDMCDARYLGEEARFYRDRPLWTGNDWAGPRVRLGHLESTVEQAIAALDFTSRNRVELHSADHSFHTELDRGRQAELERALGDGFSLNGHWCYFSLNEGEPPFTFPRAEPVAAPGPPTRTRSGWLARAATHWTRHRAERSAAVEDVPAPSQPGGNRTHV